MTIYRRILITGASSGIGEALADHYAAPNASLVLTGRDAARLEAVAARAQQAGAQVETQALDVTDRAAMAEAIIACDARAPFDLVIANAGISGGTGGGGETAEQIIKINRVNVDGMMNTIQPLIPLMAARGRGQIALMSSLAAFRGFPGAPAYGASKAWARIYGEGLRGELAGRGVGVSVICPGFVVSRMTAVNDFKMPFLMSGERAAAIIARGLAANRARIAFPWQTYLIVRILAALPAMLVDRLLTTLPAKGSMPSSGG